MPGGASLPLELTRTIRTVIHLRSDQIWHRLRLRARRAIWERRSAAINAAYRARSERLPALRWEHPGLARVAALRASRVSEADAIARADEVMAGHFAFLSRRVSFGAEVEWFREDLDTGTRLWKTLLHEFSYSEDLARAAAASGDARYAERLFALARSWRGAAPIGCRDYARDAWNTRAAANRLMHWAVAGALLGPLRGDDGDWLGREIGLHGLFVRDNLELDLKGNHLFRDAVALVFANELVGGLPDAMDWLRRQVEEQVLPDGCHLERAPMYHAVCLRDLVEVATLLGDDTPAWQSGAIARMAGFLESIALGDGELPLLGDGWLGEVDVAELLESARRIGPLEPPREPEHHGGLVALDAGDQRLVMRAGPHGPDYMLGHAHADLLSFELSRGPHRVISDTGTLLYDPGPERSRLRATASHNTIRIDGEEQLEVWGSFRAGRRGRASVCCRGGRGSWSWVSASHDAYRWRPGRPMHHRLFAVGDAGAVILDVVTGSGTHRLESHLHQHPEAPETAIAALGEVLASAQPAPLHERFGETREMTRHAVDTTTALPWCGGWLVGEIAAATPAELSFDGAELTLRLGGRHPFELHWLPDRRDAETAVYIVLPGNPGAAN